MMPSGPHHLRRQRGRHCIIVIVESAQAHRRHGKDLTSSLLQRCHKHALFHPRSLIPMSVDTKGEQPDRRRSLSPDDCRRDLIVGIEYQSIA